MWCFLFVFFCFSELALLGGFSNRRQLLSKKPPTPHMIFNRHAKTELLMHQHEICHLVAQQVRSFKFHLTRAPSDTCNCRNLYCPLEGKYLQSNVIYQATVTKETTTETYVGLATNFKERYRNHPSSFRRSNRRNETELSNIFGLYKTLRNLSR